MNEQTYSLRFPHLDREIPTRPGETLFHSARRHGVRIVGACGGRGTCGSCMVQITEGTVERAPGVSDSQVDFGKKWLRACQLTATSSCTVEVAPRSLAAVVRTETDNGEKEFLPLDSAIQAFDLSIPEASLKDNVADFDRILRALDDRHISVDLAAARQLSALIRQHQLDGHWHLRAWLRTTETDKSVIAFAPQQSPTLGLAVDLGTTNAAAFLVDLESGERLASLGIENPQVAWGADLISRINNAAKDAQTAEELRLAAVEAINALAHDLCMSVGQPVTRIVDVAICGNTAMHHLLLGLPVRQLGRAPFVSAVRSHMDVTARELGLTVAAGARAYITANVGGFVGGDHVTALLASEDQWRDLDTCLVMDIGTNTEISVIHNGRLYSASAPSGPALEGGHISCGMRAAEGAIEKVRFVDGQLQVDTIGDKEAIGLCGSGVLDTLATLHRAGLVSDTGRLANNHPGIDTFHGKKAVRLAPEVFFTQDDIRSVQLAKAAIRTATDLLLDEAGITADHLQRFIIAGSFGAYIDVASGIAIGMFPDLPRERFIQVGNAAGVGIRRMLASQTARQRADDIARQCRYMELSSRTDFQKIFLKHIGFPRLQTAAKTTHALPSTEE